MGCAFSGDNHRVPKVFRRKNVGIFFQRTAKSQKYVVSSLKDVHSKNNKLHTSSSSSATPRVWSVTPKIYTAGWYAPDVVPSTLIWLMGAKDLYENSVPELVTYSKRVENNEEVARRVGKDTEDLEEKCDVKKEGERENNTILEKELPSCLHYEGFHEKGFHWFTLYSSVLNETIDDMSLNCIPDAIATVLKGSSEPLIIVYKNSDNNTTYLSDWSGEILDRICSRFENQVLRIILCKPSWFAQTAVKEKREKFFSLLVTEKLKFASDAKEFAKLTGFPGETRKASKSD